MRASSGWDPSDPPHGGQPGRGGQHQQWVLLSVRPRRNVRTVAPPVVTLPKPPCDREGNARQRPAWARAATAPGHSWDTVTGRVTIRGKLEPWLGFWARKGRSGNTRDVRTRRARSLMTCQRLVINCNVSWRKMLTKGDAGAGQVGTQPWHVFPKSNCGKMIFPGATPPTSVPSEGRPGVSQQHFHTPGPPACGPVTPAHTAHASS